ncbi:MAG: multidrug effflux MFS transporter [Sphingomonadales bacterium]|nr:multidrug effflux MFS transporter [Sphingomonadales bacterium]
MASPPTEKPFLSIREFVTMMAMTQALQALAVDSMLPALGIMSADLGVHDSNQRQLVVGLFLLFSGLGSLVPGTLADRFGRKPVLLFCLGGYIAFTIAAALAPTFGMMLAARALGGLASSGLTVVPPAIIRDRYEGDRMARMQSMVSMTFMIVPMAAPSLGQAVLLFVGWRWIFGIMATMAVLVAAWISLRLPETLDPAHRQTLHPRHVARATLQTVTTRAALGYVFGMALVQGALFGYINSSQQLVAEHFGAGAGFPLLFAGMALAMSCASFVNSRIVVRFGARRVSHSAVFGYIVLSSLQFLLATRTHETLWTFVPVMTLNMCMMSFIGANFGSIALQPFARQAGAAASSQAFVRTICGAALGTLVGQAYDGTARPLALTMLIAGCGTLALVLFSEKGRLFRRLNPPIR